MMFRNVIPDITVLELSNRCQQLPAPYNRLIYDHNRLIHVTTTDSYMTTTDSYMTTTDSYMTTTDSYMTTTDSYMTSNETGKQTIDGSKITAKQQPTNHCNFHVLTTNHITTKLLSDKLQSMICI